MKGPDHEGFISKVKDEISTGNQMNKTQLEKLAKDYSITDQNLAKELAEAAVVEIARRVATTFDGKEAFDKIVELYEYQPNLTHRTSESVKNQQYSTPAPIAYMAGEFLADKVGNGDVLEPSAGTGMLTISFSPDQVSVNEIDKVRGDLLKRSGFAEIKSLDASKNDDLFNQKFDGVITNPPFGSADTKIIDGYKINKLEHIMAANALNQMKDSGRAAIIIGGHNVYDKKGRLKSDRTFFNWLYNHYNVKAVLNINGDLYAKQGTKFPIRLILIDGRKATPEGAALLYDRSRDAIVGSFEDLYNRVKEIRDESILQPPTDALGGRGGTSDVRNPAGIPGGGQTGLTPISEGPADKPDKGQSGGSGQVTGGRGGSSTTKQPGSKQPGGLSGGASGQPSLSPPVESGEFGNAGGGIKSEGPDGDLSENNLPNTPDVTGRDILESEKSNLPYRPRSKGVPMGTVIPKNMVYDTQKTLERIEKEVGGDIDEFVRGRLGYESKDDLFSRLGAEQIDATALAIVAIEKGQGAIIGDMAGIGKGRVAAAIIRYASINGQRPIFFTQKSKLFSDIYRDLKAIGSEDLNPFIVNNPNSEQPPDIVDEETGDVIYSAYAGKEKDRILATGNIGKHDFVVTTYTQINNEKREAKRNFIENFAADNIVILDESHEASGQSGTSEFMQKVVTAARGVTFLSATFAKRANNMPLYALKTAMSEANLTTSDLIEAIIKGGIALQEVVSTDLVESGQMIRRARTYENIKVDYTTLTDLYEVHAKIADSVTEVLRDVVRFQIEHVFPVVDGMDTDQGGLGGITTVRKGTKKAGVDAVPFISKVFNVNNQLLFSLKADATAEEAIKLLKQDIKPVIAVGNTMESFLNYLGVKEGDVIEDPDFSSVLERALRGVMRITIKDGQGKSTPSEISVNDLSPEGRKEFRRILDNINKASTGISISPIDHILNKIEKAGFRMGELTGRSLRLVFREDGKAIVERRKEKNTNKILNKFNNCNVGGDRESPDYGYDGILLNASGATGNSAQSSSEYKDQRVRGMITTQLELNINTEIQKRGRINRTNQVVPPQYNTLSTAIPAEQRLMMIARKKLKSLDANVSSDQKEADATIQASDFINKYGDVLVIEYLKENRELNDMILDPLRMNEMKPEELEKFTNKEGAANQVTGRVAILPTKLQAEFYDEIGHRYNDHIDYLNSVGENDLELQSFPLEAVTTQSRVLVVGKGGRSPFGRDSMIETVEVNVLKKPWKIDKIKELGAKLLDGKSSKERKAQHIEDFDKFWEGWQKEHLDKKIESIAKFWEITVEEVRGVLRGDQAIIDRLNPRFNLPIHISLPSQYEPLIEKLYQQGAYVRENIFKRFDMGNVYKVPLSRGEYPTFANGIFLGWEINPNRKNPYAPSAIKLKFAVSDSRQVVQLPGSQRDWLNEINGQSASLNQWEKKDILSGWDEAIPQNRRELRQIITGNVLQAIGKDAKGGKLISYTTKEGGIKRGILLAHDANITTNEIRVPIKRAKPFIKKLDEDEFIETANGNVSIIRRDHWEIEVPKSKSKGGKYYLDDKFSGLMIGKRFDGVGSKMRASFTNKNFDAVIDLLQDDFGESVRLSQDQVKGIIRWGLSYKIRPAKIHYDNAGQQIPAVHSKAHEFKLDHPATKDTRMYINDSKTVYWTAEQIVKAGYTDLSTFEDSRLLPGDFGYEKGKTQYAVDIEGYNRIILKPANTKSKSPGMLLRPHIPKKSSTPSKEDFKRKSRVI